MLPDIISLGVITIHSYGLLIAVGIAVAIFVSIYRSNKPGLHKETLLSLICWILIGGMLGARLLYIVTQINNIADDKSILYDFRQGYVVYGGIIGGLIASYIFYKKKDINLLAYLDLLAPSVALVQGFGRIGCFLAGCCWGIETDSRFGIVFPDFSASPGGIPLFPTQLLSSIFDFALFILLILISNTNHRYGTIFVLYLIIYSGGRFVIEFFRGDLIRGSIGIFSTSQIIALFILIGSFFIYHFLRRLSTQQLR